MNRLDVINRFGPNAIVTYTGRVVDLLNPKPSDIDIEDIAIGLCREFRFANQTQYPYTVAQHSVIVSALVPEKHALQGLLHDATEAYLKDIPSPLKTCLPQYKEIETKWDMVIGAAFKISMQKERIKLADKVALDFEWSELMETKNPRFTWTIEEAYRRFMQRYNAILELNKLYYAKDN